MNNSVTLAWGDGTYTFRLNCRQIEELQRLCGPTLKHPIGIGEIANRMFTGRFFMSDIVHVIRLGLIGGGVEDVRAKQLIDTYLDGRPLARPGDESSPVAVATAILQAAFFGVDVLVEEGKDDAGESVAAKDASLSTSRPLN